MPFGWFWYITSVVQNVIADGFRIVITTDNNVHMTLHWRNTPPWKRGITKIDRGFAWLIDAAWCKAKFHTFEQDEPGDTFTHTFTWHGWQVCWTRYFYFTATKFGLPCVSTSPIFAKHFKLGIQEAYFYPDPHPEITCCDGYAESSRGYDGVAWADLWAGAANNAGASSANLSVLIQSGHSSNKWRMIDRACILFDTSIIPASAVILSAELRVYGDLKYNGFTATDFKVGICASWPLSNTDIVLADYNNIGITTVSDTLIWYADWIVGGWNEFPFSTAGLAAIIKGGITKLGMREAHYDMANHAPTWQNNKYCQMRAYSVEKVGDYHPRLHVVWAP